MNNTGHYLDIDIIGIGSAYSRQYVNASLLIHQQQQCWLIDCGPTVPQAIWQRQMDIDLIDLIYFTHIHPDHCMGFASLLNYFHSMGRKKPLQIMAQKQQQDALKSMLPLAYAPDPNINFDIEWIETTQQGQWYHWTWKTAYSHHPITNRSLWIDINGFRLFYSGDGRPSEQTIQLIQSSDLIIHECSGVDPLPMEAGHADLPMLLELSEQTGTTPWRLYHCRDENHDEINEALSHHSHMKMAAQGRLILPQ